MPAVQPSWGPPLLGLALLAGCAPVVNRPADKSLLEQPRMSADSVELEIFFVRVPFADPAANRELWAELDEQSFDAGLRRRLAENGFRVGLAGAQMPGAVQRLLRLEGRAPTPEEQSQVNIGEDAKVAHRLLQVRSGRRSEVVASGIYDQLPMLLYDEGQVRGKTLPKGQGVLAVKAYPREDGRVRMELVPELHYGEARQQWRGGDEMFVLETGRPREALEQLKLEALLSPGQMLVLSSLPARPGSLGHHFMTQASGDQIEQKLLLIRLSRTSADDLFEPGDDAATP